MSMPAPRPSCSAYNNRWVIALAKHQLARTIIVLALYLTCTLPCLQHLAEHGAPYILEGLQTPLGSKTSVQQLQALHMENLQLKACLKQEVEARQLLEKKHVELLDLLRCVYMRQVVVCCSRSAALAQSNRVARPGGLVCCSCSAALSQHSGCFHV